MLIVCAIVLMVISVGSAGAANLLTNPGFEEGAVSISPGFVDSAFGWNYNTNNGVGTYFRPETVLGPVVDAGQVFVHSGLEAQDACGDTYEGDARSMLWQRIAVASGSWYTASAYVFAREMIEGAGLGSGENDFAGVRVIQLDQTGTLVEDLGLAGVYSPTTGFVQVSQTFQTKANTYYVDFVLDTLVNNANGYWGSRVIYDDCVLEAVPEPASLLALFVGISGLGGLAWRRR